MYAIIKSGGKQYRVTEGDVVRLEKLDVDAGDSIELPVLLVGGDSVTVGAPFVDGASVQAEVVGHGRGPKVHVLKFKAKNNYRRNTGHRQDFTEVRITSVSA